MHTATDEAMARIVRALAAIRIPAAPGEYDIHALIADALAADGIAFVHEAALGPRCRIDFLAGRVGVEVKKGRPAPSLVRRQLARYLASDRVDAVILAAERDVPLPASMMGKPVKAVSLSRFWGISLP